MIVKAKAKIAKPLLDKEINNQIAIIIDVGIEVSIKARGSPIKEEVNIKNNNIQANNI